MQDKKFSQPSTVSAQEQFAKAPSAEIPRSKFDRSHGYKTQMSASRLQPIYLDEVYPGDTFHMNATMFGRLATPLLPVMDNLHCDVHFWFVPNRLIWDNWQFFMGERDNPSDDPSTKSIPQATVDLRASTYTADRLSHHLGLPIRDGAIEPNVASVEVSDLPFRAYYLIYNEWYRDQNFTDSIFVEKGDTTTGRGTSVVLKRGKRKDYFTSCLPWPQKGSDVSIGLAGLAPVGTENSILTGQLVGIANPANSTTYHLMNEDGTGNSDVGAVSAGIKASGGVLHADLSNATASTINDLRTAFQIQKLLERDARGGTRYIELILSHFGVASSDARLQRPEFLGGSNAGVDIYPVASTVVEASTPQGELAAYGTFVNRSGFTKSFEEHGYIVGIASVRADLTYQDGVERHWSRSTRYDYYFPAFAHLGEQAVLNKEIYLQGDAADDQVFGYQEAWAELRYKPSRVGGQLSSNSGASLDTWHLAQEFDSLPNLGTSFIEENVPISRIVAVPSEPDFIVDCYFDLKCDRPLPVYSVPGLIDHF